ncbi:SURF1 family protein [Gammaproteobacteria bacterium]|nr:SURF1 family protein [Gammaproteobacteria bacterium]
MNTRALLRVLLLLFAIATALACVWQISRGFERNAQYDQWRARSAQEALVDPLAVDVAAHDNRRLRLSASVADDWIGYLDNRSYKGRPGYWILQTVEVDGGRMLIARGWVAASGDRRRLPPIERLTGETLLEGRIRTLDNEAINFFGVASESLGDGIHRFQQIDPDMIASTLDGIAVLPWYLQLADGDDPLVRDWPVPGPRGAHKSWGYSIQWALMSIAALFFLWRIARKPDDD